MNRFSIFWFTSCAFLGSTVLLIISFVNVVYAQLGQNRQLDGPESTVAEFHQAIQNRDFNSLDKYYCLEERAAAQALNSVVDPDGQNMALFNAYLQIAFTINSVDMSRLYYKTQYYDEQSGIAVVSITGSVVITSSDGQSLVLPAKSVFKPDWLRLINENNEWKLCYNLTEPPQDGVVGNDGSIVFQTNSRITTTISVNPGDRIIVRASGTILFGLFAGSGGPKGISFNRNYNYFTDIPHGQLIARVKQTGMQDLDGWFPVGEGREFVVQVPGVLEFAVNDNKPGDNTGKFRIEVIVDSVDQ